MALVTQDHLNRAPVFPRTMWKMNARLKDPLEMEANGWKDVDCATLETQSNKETASCLQA